jgi:hypothetical protein
METVRYNTNRAFFELRRQRSGTVSRRKVAREMWASLLERNNGPDRSRGITT